MNKRFREVIYCNGCRKELDINNFFCSDCGGSVINGKIDRFAVAEEIYIEMKNKFVWYKPSTWFNTCFWQIIQIKDCYGYTLDSIRKH
jgi:hypothetical protein